MLEGKQVVFLSCMTAYGESLVKPIGDRLNAAGYRAVIAMYEPNPLGNFNPEDKVDQLMQASDAFVALATADRRVSQTRRRWQWWRENSAPNTAQNIIDEIGRARVRPNLRDKVLVMKQASVQLPSNINPVYEQLDANNPDAAFQIIKRQLEAWGVSPAVATPSPPPVTALPDDFIAPLFQGIGLADHTAADAKLRGQFATITKEDQHRVARGIFDHLRTLPGAGEEIHVATYFLQGCVRIDPALIEPAWIEELVDSQVVQHRMCATSILRLRAVIDPGSVPLDYVAKLAKPSTEDWYVWAEAIATAKELALTRRDALEILLDLARSDEVNDRFTAVHALREIAEVDPSIVGFCARDEVRQLANDSDEAVAKPAAELLQELQSQTYRWPRRYGQFTL